GAGLTCSFGSGITVNSCTFSSSTQLTASITIASTAATGARTVVVTNPDTQSGSLATAFSAAASSQGAPTGSGVSPSSGAQGQTISTVSITGTNFQSGAGLTCSFGAGITVNSCTFSSSTQLTASITIASTATAGARTVVVTNPDTQSGSLATAF